MGLEKGAKHKGGQVKENELSGRRRACSSRILARGHIATSGPCIRVVAGPC